MESIIHSQLKRLGDGHQIKAIFLSGGQARNTHLMQLLANVCQMDVVLPGDVEGSVVRGAAILGRFAHDVQDGSQETNADLLWKIMVCRLEAEF